MSVKLRSLSALSGTALLLAATVAFCQAPTPPEDGAGPSTEEQQLLDLTNVARDAQGLGPLRWDAALATAAAEHNQRMRGQPELSHQYAGEDPLLQRAAHAGVHFSSIAENIALGPSADAIEREWLQSAPHRANIFDPRMNSIGIAVVRRGGDLYATEDFAQTVINMSPQEAEAKVSALLQAQGLSVSTDQTAIRDARETCEMNQGSAGGTQPKFIIRWESPALNQLPDALTQKLAGGGYKSAAVGTCTSMRPQQGFTTYRMAVLLF